MQEAVDLAQAVFAGPAPGGCNRVVRKELIGQIKLVNALREAGYASVLTEGEVPIDVVTKSKGRFDILIDSSVVVELKNTQSLYRRHDIQIRDYMTQLGCTHGVLINFPNINKTTVEAKSFIYTKGCREPVTKALHASQIYFD